MRKALLAALAVAILGGASVAFARTAPVEITKNGFAQPTVEPTWTTQVTTTTGGNWTLQVQPRIRTTYQATYEDKTSAPLTVNVRPRITLQKVGRNSFLVVVLAQHAMAGKTVDVTRS